MAYYLAIKKNEILLLSNTWMEVENILLSEVSQAQKDKGPMLSLIPHIKGRTDPNIYTSINMYIHIYIYIYIYINMFPKVGLLKET
jgi:hypothetical protein